MNERQYSLLELFGWILFGLGIFNLILNFIETDSAIVNVFKIAGVVGITTLVRQHYMLSS
jgi:hypothetical protein